MIIAVDFDGTVVENKFPEVGEELEGAVNILRSLVHHGHSIVLNTMRSDIWEPVYSPEFEGQFVGTYLTDAEKWFEQKGIKLAGINKAPRQAEWTSNPKCYADLYIDDRALGCPLKDGVVDWEKVLAMLIEMGAFSH